MQNPEYWAIFDNFDNLLAFGEFEKTTFDFRTMEYAFQTGAYELIEISERTFTTGQGEATIEIICPQLGYRAAIIGVKAICYPTVPDAWYSINSKCSEEFTNQVMRNL